MIRVVDSLMGSGKTTYFIRHINEHPEQKYIYVTPYISECERIQQECIALDFQQPEREGNMPKMASFTRLIREGKNIATTHELFKNIDDTPLLRERMQSYTLIMDEVLETVGTINEIGRTDINMLLQKNLIEKAENDLVIWRNNSAETERFRDVRTISRRNSLYLLSQNTLFIWLFPVDVLPVFREVYILTYMFQASHMRCMLDMHHISYEVFHIHNGELHEGRENTDKTELRNKIIICDRLNELDSVDTS